MTPERKAVLLRQARGVMTMTAGTSDDAKAAIYRLAALVEELVEAIVPEVKR